ncbi:MAG: hypothetical protein ACK559_29920, partial [bacterium]
MLETYRDLTSAQLRVKLRQISADQLVVVVNAGSAPDRDLVDDLQMRGANVQDSEVQDVWIAAASNGMGSCSKQQGLTAHFPD